MHIKKNFRNVIYILKPNIVFHCFGVKEGAESIFGTSRGTCYGQACLINVGVPLEPTGQ